MNTEKSEPDILLPTVQWKEIQYLFIGILPAFPVNPYYKAKFDLNKPMENIIYSMGNHFPLWQVF